MPYKSIFEQILEQMQGEGHTHIRISIKEDKAELSLPPNMTFPSHGSSFKNPYDRGKGVDANEGEGQLNLAASSNIQSAAYFPTKKYLLVSFKSGSTYSYDNVPEDLVDAWQRASSAGRFHYYNIRKSFPYRKM